MSEKRLAMRVCGVYSIDGDNGYMASEQSTRTIESWTAMQWKASFMQAGLQLRYTPSLVYALSVVSIESLDNALHSMGDTVCQLVDMGEGLSD